MHSESVAGGGQFLGDCLRLGDCLALVEQLGDKPEAEEVNLSCVDVERLGELVELLGGTRKMREVKVKLFGGGSLAEGFMRALAGSGGSGELKRLSVWVNPYSPTSSEVDLDFVRSRIARLSVGDREENSVGQGEGEKGSTGVGTSPTVFEKLDVSVDDSKRYDPSTELWTSVYPWELAADEGVRGFVGVHCVSRFARL